MSEHILLAPFQGITNKVYRNAYASHFPWLDAVYSPFISGVNPVKVNPTKFTDVLPLHENPVTTVPQFVSTDSREIIAMATFLEQHGYKHINWNMGCPFSRLANKKRGCGILPFPELIRSLLDHIMPNIRIHLSIKLRLGYYNPEELSQVMPVLNEYPLHLIIIHPRIGTQIYRGEVNLDAFEHSLNQSILPIAYNGDIYHATRYRELKTRFPALNSWMIGRGALINPFLAAQMRNITLEDAEKRQRIMAFHQELINFSMQSNLAERRKLGFLKSVWYYMQGVFEHGAQYFEKIKVCRSFDEYLQIAEQLMQQPFADEEAIEMHFRSGLKHI